VLHLEPGIGAAVCVMITSFNSQLLATLTLTLLPTWTACLRFNHNGQQLMAKGSALTTMSTTVIHCQLQHQQTPHLCYPLALSVAAGTAGIVDNAGVIYARWCAISVLPRWTVSTEHSPAIPATTKAHHAALQL
jgi:hypothetical protein